MTDELPNTLHLYGQYMWHSPAKIVGTRAALKELQEAIRMALSINRPTSIMPMVNDGESYTLEIIPMNDDVMETQRVPYIDEIARSES